MAFGKPVEMVMQVSDFYNGRMVGVQGIHYLDTEPGFTSITDENGTCDNE